MKPGEIMLVIHGGERITVEGDYQEVSSWFAHQASRTEVKQFQTRKTYPHDPFVTVSSAQLVAVIGDRE
jgi:hypothetical protein